LTFQALILISSGISAEMSLWEGDTSAFCMVYAAFFDSCSHCIYSFWIFSSAKNLFISGINRRASVLICSCVGYEPGGVASFETTFSIALSSCFACVFNFQSTISGWIITIF